MTPTTEFHVRLAFWEAAKSEPIGVILNCSDVLAWKMALYQVRIKANDPSLADLQIRTIPPELANEGNLIICHEASAPKPTNNTSYNQINLDGILQLDLDV